MAAAKRRVSRSNVSPSATVLAAADRPTDRPIGSQATVSLTSLVNLLRPSPSIFISRIFLNSFRRQFARLRSHGVVYGINYAACKTPSSEERSM